MRAAALGVAFALGLIGPSMASAQAEAPGTEDQRIEEALVLYERARERYEAGDFERSVVLLEEALSLHDAPELHYNLARALQELGRWAAARRQYVLYRERSPDSAVAERVQARIALLDRRIAEEAAEAAAASEPAPAPEPPPDPPLDPAPWVLAGAGGAVGLAGIPFGILAVDADRTAREAPNHELAYGPAQDATNFAIVANVLFGVGVVTGLVGIVWGLVSAIDR